MTNSAIDHERCSELLAQYVREELDRATTETVRRHLETCAECSQEHQGVRYLLGPDPDPLTDDEKTRLDRALRAALTPAGGQAALARAASRAGGDESAAQRTYTRRGRPSIELASIAPARRGKARRRLAAALAAAAVVVLFGGLYVAARLSGGIGAGGGSAQVVAAKTSENRGAAAASQGGANKLASEPGSTRAPQKPVFVGPVGDLSARDIRRTGRSGAGFVSFARDYTVGGARHLRRPFLADLGAGAPASNRKQIEACARVVFRSEHYALLPAYGATGRVDGRDVLALGFVWTPKTKGHLDRYMIWAWPNGSCATPIAYQAGFISYRS
jgi:anti-sigma factor RsiW